MSDEHEALGAAAREPFREIDWRRQRPGLYEGRDQMGTFWRIVQAGSAKWEVYHDDGGPKLAFWLELGSLGSAKLGVADEVKDRLDPARSIRRARRRAELRARSHHRGPESR